MKKIHHQPIVFSDPSIRVIYKYQFRGIRHKSTSFPRLTLIIDLPLEMRRKTTFRSVIHLRPCGRVMSVSQRQSPSRSREGSIATPELRQPRRIPGTLKQSLTFR